MAAGGTTGSAASALAHAASSRGVVGLGLQNRLVHENSLVFVSACVRARVRTRVTVSVCVCMCVWASYEWGHCKGGSTCTQPRPRTKQPTNRQVRRSPRQRSIGLHGPSHGGVGRDVLSRTERRASQSAASGHWLGLANQVPLLPCRARAPLLWRASAATGPADHIS